MVEEARRPALAVDITAASAAASTKPVTPAGRASVAIRAKALSDGMPGRITRPLRCPTGRSRAARREDPLPDVLPDHEPEEEEQKVGEDSLPPDCRQAEVRGRQGFQHP